MPGWLDRTGNPDGGVGRWSLGVELEFRGRVALGTLHESTVTNAAKILWAYLTQNHLLQTRRSDRGAIDGGLSRRLLENEDNEATAAVNERRRQIGNLATYTDDPDGQTIGGATDNEEVDGAHGSSVLV
jgi:hypothetical protein